MTVGGPATRRDWRVTRRRTSKLIAPNFGANGDTVDHYGDAKSYGSASKLSAGNYAAGVAVTPDGRGYWVVTQKAAVYPLGDAKKIGSTKTQKVSAPVVGVAGL